MSIKEKIVGKSASYIIKAFLSKYLGTRILKFHYLTLDIADVKVPKDLMLPEIKELEYNDFKKGDASVFKNEKLNLINNRLQNPHYTAYGILENDRLLYSTWISDGVLTMPNGQQYPIIDDEGILEDSYCSPMARGRGFHSKMNFFRISKFKDLRKSRIIAIVLDGNTPAMKVQTKSGFKEKFCFYSGNILGIPFTTKLRR